MIDKRDVVEGKYYLVRHKDNPKAELVIAQAKKRRAVGDATGFLFIGTRYRGSYQDYEIHDTIVII